MQENLANLKEAEFKNLTVRPVVGRSHKVSWAARRNSPELIGELNKWIEEKKEGPLFNTLYKKYFVDRRRYLERVTSQYLTSTTGKLCEYDDLLKQYAADLNWDWRLLARLNLGSGRYRGSVLNRVFTRVAHGISNLNQFRFRFS